MLIRDYEFPSDFAKECTATFLANFRQECRRPEKPKLSKDERRILMWRQALGEEYDEHAEVIYDKWAKLRYTNLVITKDTTDFLQELRKQYHLALLTNGHSDYQWEKINELELEDHFDAIVVSGDHDWEKPDPRMFHKACNDIGVQPSECLMIGDNLETDIRGGILAQLGIIVWFPFPGDALDSSSPTPDFTIRELSKLVDILGLSGNDENGNTPNANVEVDDRNSRKGLRNLISSCRISSGTTTTTSSSSKSASKTSTEE